MSHRIERRRSARRHRWPVCELTGKTRYRECNDAKSALAQIRRVRARVEEHGLTSRRRECRGYLCPACRGWHLTSQAS